MQKLMFASVLAAVAFVGGCITTDEMRNRWVYTCPDGYTFDVEFTRDGDHAKFDDGEQQLKLDRLESASGERWVEDDFVFWTKGALAMIRNEGQLLHADCQGEKR